MDELAVLSLAAIAVIKIKQKKNRRKRKRERLWVAKKNEESDVIDIVHQELRLEDIDCFRDYLRMDEECFKKLLTSIENKITHADTCMRPAIPAYRRLSVTLRYLATGNTLKDLSFSTRMPHNTISVIITEVLNAIVECLQDEYLKVPNTVAEWLSIARAYYNKWDFPNCLGALAGKHITFRRSSGSLYGNNKGTDSIVLQALVSADYKFLIVDIGTNGGISDGAVFSRSIISRALQENLLNFPPEKALPGRNMPVPHVVVSDDAFPLKEHIMKPYKRREMSQERQIYNYRLFRAQRTVENAFGILTTSFRILLQPINLKIEKVELITKAVCILHNFLLNNSNNYASTDDAVTDCSLSNIIQQGGNRTADKPQIIREEYRDYFNTNGRVAWQDEPEQLLINI